jgi:hypothetical protein
MRKMEAIEEAELELEEEGGVIPRYGHWFTLISICNASEISPLSKSSIVDWSL